MLFPKISRPRTPGPRAAAAAVPAALALLSPLLRGGRRGPAGALGFAGRSIALHSERIRRKTRMALLDDLAKGANPTNLAIGIGTALLAPVLAPAVSSVLRPAARAVMSTGITLYRGAMEPISAAVGNLVTEAQMELATASNASADVPAGRAVQTLVLDLAADPDGHGVRVPGQLTEQPEQHHVLLERVQDRPDGLREVLAEPGQVRRAGQHHAFLALLDERVVQGPLVHGVRLGQLPVARTPRSGRWSASADR